MLKCYISVQLEVGVIKQTVQNTQKAKKKRSVLKTSVNLRLISG